MYLFMFTLFTVIQESKFMRSTYGTLVTIFHICLEVFPFCTKIVQKTFLFPTEQVTIQCHKENSPKTALRPKSSHFSLLFCQKVLFNYNNAIQTSCGHHLYLWSQLLYFKIFNLLSKYVKSVVTHFNLPQK